MELQKEHDIEKDSRIKFLIDKIFSGTPLYISAQDNFDRGIFTALPINNDEWETLTAKSKKTLYKSIPFYREKNGVFFFTRLGGFAVVTETVKEIKRIIDLALGSSANSLGNDATYKNITGSFFSPSIFSYFHNYFALVKHNENNAYYDEFDRDRMFASLLAIHPGSLKAIGVSVKENSDGYSFTINGEQGDLKKILDKTKFGEIKSWSRDSRMSQEEAFNVLFPDPANLNLGGNFIPNLYKKFPNAKPIFYTESFNQKTLFPRTNRQIGLLGELRAQFNKLKTEGTFDVDVFFDTFDQELAFAIQYDQSSTFPYFTLLGNVSNAREAGVKSASHFIEKILDALQKTNETREKNNAELKQLNKNIPPEEIIPYTQTISGPFTKITIDLDILFNNDGVPLGNTTLTIGVTPDGLLIASNYPGIEEAMTRTGFSSHVDLGSLPGMLENSVGTLYFSLRNYVGWADQLIARAEDSSENYPDLSFYRKHYPALEGKFYKWRDLVVFKQATENDATIQGKFTLDDAKHKTFAARIQELKSKDGDGDGLSDFDERYLYTTPIHSADSDNDGIMDAEELKKGLNPNGEGQLFKDVPANTDYTEAVSVLNRRDVVSGYSNGRFKPHKLVNRAEFVVMAMRAWKFNRHPTWSLLGRRYTIDDDLSTTSYSRFADVPKDAWYAGAINRAYDYVIMREDSPLVEYGPQTPYTSLYFHPSKLITRAEALSILKNISLQYDAMGEKTDSSSASDDTLTRAQAAGLIMDMLKQDNEFLSSEPLSTSQGLLDLFDVFNSIF